MSAQKRRRENGTHRWTESETRQLLDRVLTEIKLKGPDGFEKPTSQRFYSKVSSGAALLKPLKWNILKCKMRHLKSTYMSAWKLHRDGEQITDGEDKTDMKNIKKVCPHFDILDQIFCQQVQMDVNTKTEVVNGVTYTVSFDDEDEEENSELTNDSAVDALSPQKEGLLPEPSSPTEMDFSTFKNQFHKEDGRKTKMAKNSGSISVLVAMQEKKLHFEQMKLAKQVELEKEKMGLEKSRQQIEIKKIELQHELEVKKLEVDRDERIALAKMRLEMETAERIKKYKMELENMTG